MTNEKTNNALQRSLYLFQGIYYLLTGLWPIVHMRSFEMASGEKQEHWLVKTVGALTAVIGTTYCLAAVKDSQAEETPFLAVGGSMAFTTIDVVYVLQKRIPPIYLADAVIQIGLIIAWIIALRSK